MKHVDIYPALNMIVEGFLRQEGDAPETLTEAVQALRQLADDWAENLPDTVHNQNSPFGIETLIREKTQEYADLMGGEDARTMLTKVLNTVEEIYIEAA